MNREEAKSYLQARGRDYLKRDRSGKGYVCPICGSGEGKNGTGITTKDGVHFTCWAGCFTNADIIDIIGLKTGATDYNSKLYAAAREFNITIESGYSRSTAREDFSPIGAENQNQPKNEQDTQFSIHNAVYTTPPKEEPETDYTDFYKRAAEDLERTDYHRGLSLGTLRRFNVGFVESWKHPKAPKMQESPRLIVPTSPYSYLARYAGEGDYINFRGQKENKSKVGSVRIFNEEAAYNTAQPVFVVEGEIDAMSIVEVGGEAVGLGSMGNVKKLLSLLEKRKPSQPLIIALDNDKDPATRERVEARTRELETGLERLGIAHYRADITAHYKDANEALQEDRAALRSAITKAINQAEQAEAEALEAEKEQLRREAVAYSLNDFMKNIEDSKRAAFIPTGFPSLDSVLDGGLYAGLYIVGAVSSLGKTTFALQIADTVAASGQDVLIFSLEMARNELIAKSISRLTLTLDIEQNGTTEHAKTTRGILTGTRYKDYSETEQRLIRYAIANYAINARNVYIIEGIGNVGTEDIRDEVKKHIKLTGKPPLVVIDYLQIIASPSDRLTDKQATDKNVLELKRLSRDYSIPIIGISSFNRDNYTAPVNLASFKESGAIEYSSDVLIGLQYEGMDYLEGEAEKTREKRIRELAKEAVEAGKRGEAQKIQVKVLKNRNGSKGQALIDFYPMFNYFTEKAIKTSSESASGWSKAESTYSSGEKKTKKSKREAEREKLQKAFEEVEQDGKAELVKLADALDLTKRQVQNLVAEYGGFSIIGETVERKAGEDLPEGFTEVQDELPLPW